MPREVPASWISMAASSFKTTAKSMSERVCPESPLLSPPARVLFVSVAVNSTNPSPQTIRPAETAPAVQPALPVFVSVRPMTVTPASEAKLPKPISTLERVAPVLLRAVSTRSGKRGAERLV